MERCVEACPVCKGVLAHARNCPEVEERERHCTICEAVLEPDDYVLCSSCYQEHPGD